MKMRKLCGLLLTLALVGTALADPLTGTVYGVYPEGVMINRGGGAVLVPTQHATFEIGGMRATWSSLQPGMDVHAYLPDPYLPQIVQVSDPYGWKMKHHPNHPHGGPPGQMKKQWRANKNYKGNKGKGRGRR